PPGGRARESAAAEGAGAQAPEGDLGERQRGFELRHGIFLEAQNSISVSNIDTAWPLIQTLPSASPLNSSSTSTRPGRWSDAPWMPEKRTRSPLRSSSRSCARYAPSRP